MDIAVWLRNLGQERYEATFRENEIDADALPELTEAHLKELGVPLGKNSQSPLNANRKCSGDSLATRIIPS